MAGPARAADDFPRPSAARFGSTAWSCVLQAGRAGDPAARPALAELCRQYWFPLYAYLRRRGSGAAEAEDAVQSFFAWLLEKNIVGRADPERGRFRGFLVAAFQQFLARRHVYDSAARRCPPGPLASIDTAAGEARYAHELADDATPERVYEYAWAMSVLSRAMDRLRVEYEAGGRSDRFQAFQGTLTGQVGPSARELGRTLGLSEGAVRVAVHRLKQRYGELLREEVASTLETADDCTDELRYLLAALKMERPV